MFLVLEKCKLKEASFHTCSDLKTTCPFVKLIQVMLADIEITLLKTYQIVNTGGIELLWISLGKWDI